jgi:Cu-Zn family superoxide dismutase
MNKFTLLGVALVATLCFSACESVEKKAEVIIQAKSDSSISGTVTFVEKNGVVTLTADIKGLSGDSHAIHIHEKGDCSANDGTSAGGHWNPTGENHGKWKEGEFHSGDIGNLTVNDNGEGKITKATDLWCIGCDDKNKNILGKAIIIHKGVDDFTSQPSGAAGARIGCGEITSKS